ncbi:MAG: type VII secretion protein EccE [Mycobacterium sp.]|nr:type VII secretion protein EccE [Mycobacterium sp.]
MKDLTRIAVVAGALIAVVIGWGFGGYGGAAAGLMIAVLLGVVPWRGHPLWSWADLYLRRNRPFALNVPVTVANDRTGGGVRYQDGIAVTAIQILGKPYRPTTFTGSTGMETGNTLDIAGLIPSMRQSLGLDLESISVVSRGARRRPTGDYPRVYDTLIGTPPYAGQRETWLVVRINALDNGDALRWRTTVGASALAAAQRISMLLRRNGIRARVATATDIVELERRLGANALESHNRRWNSVRSDAGWQTTYAYRPADICTGTLAQAWALRADGIVQNVTVFGDGTATATVTVQTAQPPTAPPAVVLQALPGEQAQALAANLCGPRPHLRGLSGGPIPQSVIIPTGVSGVLLGKTAGGDRLALPLSDPAEPCRVHIAAEDAIAKRIIIRAAGAGERVTVHSTDLKRWGTLRMPHVAVIEHPRPASGTTVSITDGTVPPAPRPHTVISVGPPGGAIPPADVVISQTGPEIVEVSAAGRTYELTVEFFRAENRYASEESGCAAAELEMAYQK